MRIFGGAVVAALLVLTASPVPAAAADEAEPLTVPPGLVIDEDFPDPDVTRFGDTYYAYSTNNANGHVPYATAPSVDGPWTIRGNALPALGAWASSGYTWAPDVSQRADGSYLLYYTARSTATNRQCIGAAVASSPAGPFAPLGSGPLVCDPAEGGDIDASSFTDADGSRYLLYKDDGNAIGQPTQIWLQPVAADGVTFTGPRTELLRSDRADEGGVIEAPVLVRRASQYVLFYSANGYGGDAYVTSYATSPSLTGTYTKAFRPLMSTASVDGRVSGPGGQDIVGDHIVFHGWINGNTQRGMYVADLGWANDFPVVRGSRVRYEAESGRLNNAIVRDNAAGASQGRVAAGIDHADSWVEITVFAPTPGAYTAHVGYAAGYGDAQHTLTVNGGAATVVDYPDQGWDNWRQRSVPVELAAGWNTLRFQHRTAWAELDYVEVA
ncbi:family 43 glycosylhydrolase [Allonocardiopsis opalescens]|uniref:family 43 glycosylhydrolase n=1 Tax=Allonocardiopsis opalescens TaxID=1144618 RepID=UPI001B8067B6|nr:family 43 glycosylhydrolase [Allonocardiopsis opalescens]